MNSEGLKTNTQETSMFAYTEIEEDSRPNLRVEALPGFIQASMSKFKDFSKHLQQFSSLMKNTDLSVKIRLQKCWTEIMETLALENYIKLLCLYLVQHKLHQIKAQLFYADLGL